MSSLKKIYTARGRGDAYVLNGLLQAAGIESVIRGDDFVPLQSVGLLSVDTRPSVWVLDDEHYEDALEMATEFAASPGEPTESSAGSWRCRSCGETIEGQFTDCWNCGTARR